MSEIESNKSVISVEVLEFVMPPVFIKWCMIGLLHF